MTKRFPGLVSWAVLSLLLLGAVPLAAAQDTRGALVPGTLIRLADGGTADVADLDVGTRVLTWAGTGATLPGTVTAVRRTHADSYLLVKAGAVEVQATGSHRIVLSGGRAVRLDALKPGDKVLVAGAKGPTEVTVTSVRVYPANLIAYDLTIEGDRFFFAGDLVVAD